MKFRSTILLATLALIAAILAASLGAVVTVLENAARDRLTAELARSQTILKEVQSNRQKSLRSEARVVAEEPRLKAATGAEEISQATIVGVAFEMRKALGSDIFILTDDEGTLLADAKDSEASGELGERPVVKTALEKGQAHAIWTEESRAYQVQAQQLAFGADVVGVLIVGLAMNDEFMRTVQRQTGGIVAIDLGGQIVASASGEGDEAVDSANITSALVNVPPEATAIEVSIDGVRYVVSSSPMEGHSGERALRSVVLKSLDRALAPAVRLQRLMYGISGGGLVVAIALAFLVAGRLSRPIDALVGFTKKVSDGNLDARADASGPIEMKSLAVAMNQMVGEIRESRDQLAAKERLEGEMEIARRVQTSILPKNLEVPGLEIAARMVTASEVGGDYYDVIRTEGGAWIGIGDVAGHGLPAGLVMLMLQSGVSGLVQSRPDASPAKLVGILNRIVHDNVRHRMDQDEHATFCLIRYTTDGGLTYAGAHEEILIYRAETRACEILDTPGTWLGAIDEIEHVTHDSTAKLEPGDVMLLYTDGVIEATTEDGDMFGNERMQDALIEAIDRPVDGIADHILASVRKFTSQQDDDVSLLVARFSG